MESNLKLNPQQQAVKRKRIKIKTNMLLRMLNKTHQSSRQILIFHNNNNLNKFKLKQSINKAKAT